MGPPTRPTAITINATVRQHRPLMPRRASEHKFEEYFPHPPFPKSTIDSQMPDNLNQKPKVLIVTASSWFPTARLAMALAHAGCSVDAICPAGHPMRKFRAVSRTYFYRGLAPLNSLAHAIAETKPDLIVPGDDLATSQLHQLHAREG